MEEIPIGKAIARARHRKKLTQMALAHQLGVTRNAVALWESGTHFPARHLGAIEQVLEISLSAYEQVAS